MNELPDTDHPNDWNRHHIKDDLFVLSSDNISNYLENKCFVKNTTIKEFLDIFFNIIRCKNVSTLNLNLYPGYSISDSP